MDQGDGVSGSLLQEELESMLANGDVEVSLSLNK